MFLLLKKSLPNLLTSSSTSSSSSSSTPSSTIPKEDSIVVPFKLESTEDSLVLEFHNFRRS